MADKHTVHLKGGGKVVIDGDRVELHLKGPIVLYASHGAAIQRMLEEAFAAVPMTVHQEAGE